MQPAVIVDCGGLNFPAGLPHEINQCFAQNGVAQMSHMQWFVGVRLLSQFSPKTASVLKSALDQLGHLSTSLVQKRRRTFHVAFFSEADAKLFKFNLHHYATMAGTFCEPFASDLAEFRSGYSGLSGFVEEEMRHEMGR